MQVNGEDWDIRAAAFQQVRRLAELRIHITAADLREGFTYNGQRLPFINPQRGIFKPKEMRSLLSIRTVYPKPGATVWYDDQRRVHSQIYSGDATVDYSFMGKDAEAAENRWLREAMERQTPIIYFLGASPGNYQAVLPAFVTGWDANTLAAQVAFGDPAYTGAPKPPQDQVERRYALRLIKQRLHQATFRDAVMAAYRGRCALSNFPETILLDAAHIVADADENLGHPIVSNGLPLSKIHHAAFDAHLIGIDADYRVHVSKRLLVQKDGPVLEAMKSLHGGRLNLPTRDKDRPDRERLERRFQLFKSTA